MDAGPYDESDIDPIAYEQVEELFAQQTNSQKLETWLSSLERWRDESSDADQIAAYDEAIDNLSVAVESGADPEALFRAFDAGMAAEEARVRDFNGIYDQGIKSRRASSLGGEATRTSREDTQLAIDMLKECRAARISETEARRRAIARMKSEKNVEMSLTTIGRIARKNPVQR